MRRTRRPQLVIFPLALALAAACDAGADDVAPIGAAHVDAADFAPVNRSDVTGTVQLEEEDDQATVTLELVGLEPGASYPTHVHSGRCAAGGPVAVPLGQVTAGEDGRGRLTTRVATSDLASARPAFVQAHAPSGGVVACADLGGDADGPPLTDRLQVDSPRSTAPADTAPGTGEDAGADA